jgi:hypothetical protein
VQPEEDDFARKIGDSFDVFLQDNGLSRNVAAERMRLNRGTVNTYCCDKKKDGKRVLASAEFFIKACLELGFVFEYQGRKVGELRDHSQNGAIPAGPSGGQLSLPFARSFDLADEQGTVSVTVRRPPGRVEVSVSLKAVS